MKDYQIIIKEFGREVETLIIRQTDYKTAKAIARAYTYDHYNPYYSHYHLTELKEN